VGASGAVAQGQARYAEAQVDEVVRQAGAYVEYARQYEQCRYQHRG
jgi:hypothetical protein